MCLISTHSEYIEITNIDIPIHQFLEFMEVADLTFISEPEMRKEIHSLLAPYQSKNRNIYV